MNTKDRKVHWEKIYNTKNLNEVSWYQPIPTTSLNFLEQFKIPKSAKIIDVGGGDSFFVDHLLKHGYTDITVLDISEAALERAKKRLSEDASKIKWIVADAANFEPTEVYDFWHDRATFHFLTSETEIDQYLETAQKHLSKNGHLILGTFSDQGPLKCSGIEIRQYTEITMADTLKRFFEKIQCIRVNHETPFDTTQNFLFCSFKKRI
ncbi:MAG: class I SAM-dependent methyltransferase [bacterium]|nr:class I SAM-dependent methyltransferase [bacterium]